MRLRYFFPFVAKGIENSKLMQTSSDFSSRKPIFSIQGNWQERSSFQKDVKKQVLHLHSTCTLNIYFLQFAINTTFVGKYLDVFFQSSQLGNLDTFIVNIILIFLGQVIKVDFHHEKNVPRYFKNVWELEHYSVRLLSLADYYLPYHYWF